MVRSFPPPYRIPGWGPRHLAVRGSQARKLSNYEIPKAMVDSSHHRLHPYYETTLRVVGITHTHISFPRVEDTVPITRERRMRVRHSLRGSRSDVIRRRRRSRRTRLGALTMSKEDKSSVWPGHRVTPSFVRQDSTPPLRSEKEVIEEPVGVELSLSQPPSDRAHRHRIRGHFGSRTQGRGAWNFRSLVSEGG